MASVRNNPNSAGARSNLAYGYLGSNRPDEAWQTQKQLQSSKKFWITVELSAHGRIGHWRNSGSGGL
jgi:hypothetical protein